VGCWGRFGRRFERRGCRRRYGRGCGRRCGKNASIRRGFVAILQRGTLQQPVVRIAARATVSFRCAIDACRAKFPMDGVVRLCKGYLCEDRHNKCSMTERYKEDLHETVKRGTKKDVRRSTAIAKSSMFERFVSAQFLAPSSSRRLGAPKTHASRYKLTRYVELQRRIQLRSRL
jgi:hypothetical protein